MSSTENQRRAEDIVRLIMNERPSGASRQDLETVIAGLIESTSGTGDTGAKNVPDLVVNSTTSATSNALKIQARLDSAGHVIVDAAAGSVIYVDRPLIIGSNTKLELGHDVTLKLKPGVNDNLIKNSGFVRAGTTVSSLSLSTRTVTVNATAHGLVAGDYASIQFCRNPGINGVHKVLTATANAFTFSAENPVKNVYSVSSGTPTAITAGSKAEFTYTVSGLAVGDVIELRKPSFQKGLVIAEVACFTTDTLSVIWENIGSSSVTPAASETYTLVVGKANGSVTMVAETGWSAVVQVRKADYNISIVGGTLDYDYANQTGLPNLGLQRHMCNIVGVKNFTFAPQYAKNAKKFVLHLANCDTFTVGDIEMDTQSDGIHVAGGCGNGKIGRITGTFGDDAVAVTTNDFYAFAPEVQYGGDNYNIDIDGAGSQSTTASIALYNSSASPFQVDRITIKGVSPYLSPVKILGAAANDVGYFGEISVSKIAGATAGGNPQVTASLAVIRRFALRDCTYSPSQTAAGGGLLNMDSNCQVDNFTINGVLIPDSSVPSGTATMVVLPQIRTGSISNMSTAMNSATGSGLSLLQTNNPFETLMLENIKFCRDAVHSYSSNLFSVNPGAKFKQLILCGIDIDATSGFYLASSGTVVLNGVYGPNVNWTLFDTANNVTITFQGESLFGTDGKIVAFGGAGTVVNPQSWNFRIDVSDAHIAKTRGLHAFHTGSTNPGLAYADGTNWKNLNGLTIV